ncbi:hypothetical protein QJQ45_026083 [Haematococcus lacustris]|nr:hypothetical protein QJQ45_026083 [Haematococcus lacustris]
MQSLKQALTAMDLNKNGKVTWTEFRAYMSANWSASKTADNIMHAAPGAFHEDMITIDGNLRIVDLLKHYRRRILMERVLKGESAKMEKYKPNAFDPDPTTNLGRTASMRSLALLKSSRTAPGPEPTCAPALGIDEGPEEPDDEDASYGDLSAPTLYEQVLGGTTIARDLQHGSCLSFTSVEPGARLLAAQASKPATYSSDGRPLHLPDGPPASKPSKLQPADASECGNHRQTPSPSPPLTTSSSPEPALQTHAKHHTKITSADSAGVLSGSVFAQTGKRKVPWESNAVRSGLLDVSRDASATLSWSGGQGPGMLLPLPTKAAAATASAPTPGLNGFRRHVASDLASGEAPNPTPGISLPALGTRATAGHVPARQSVEFTARATAVPAEPKAGTLPSLPMLPHARKEADQVDLHAVGGDVDAGITGNLKKQVGAIGSSIKVTVGSLFRSMAGGLGFKQTEGTGDAGYGPKRPGLAGLPPLQDAPHVPTEATEPPKRGVRHGPSNAMPPKGARKTGGVERSMGSMVRLPPTAMSGFNGPAGNPGGPSTRKAY